jgi:triosephosphate isomerase (TIM)
MRTPIIAGNWKMHNTISESVDLVKQIHYGLSYPGEVDVIVAPVFTALADVARFAKDSYIEVAAQNIFWEESGAYTGEIAPGMLKEAGANYVIIGHSERRKYFGETDATVNKRLNAALQADLTPIMCIGETLEEREAGQVHDVLHTQLTAGLAGLTSASNLVIAYEPVWAIGTGVSATPEQAEEAHVIVRSTLAEIFDQSSADEIRILYGGSVKPANSKELLALPNVDGALIGGASLKADDFIAIIKSL